MQSRRKRKTLILSILVVGLFVIWTVVPIYMLISQSVKPENIMFADPPKLFISRSLTTLSGYLSATIF